VQAEKEALPAPKMQVNGVTCKDPFLAALVEGDADTAEERFREETRLADEFSAVEKQLQDRANQTGQRMQQVLELVRVRAWFAALAAGVQHARLHRAMAARATAVRHRSGCAPMMGTLRWRACWKRNSAGRCRALQL
jgi:hypothetical protein